METTEIQERNKQIALMLGYINTTPTDKDFNIFENKEKPFSAIPKMIETRSMEFHSDWNWLMEAVEFVESRGYEIDIFANCVEICTTPDEDYVSEAVGKTKKEAVFVAVSDFAKLYNEKKL